MEEEFACCCSDLLHLGDDLFEVPPVGDPAPVELGLARVESAAYGLAGDRSAPLVVGAVALWRVALAAATRVPARAEMASAKGRKATPARSAEKPITVKKIEVRETVPTTMPFTPSHTQEKTPEAAPGHPIGRQRSRPRQA